MADALSGSARRVQETLRGLGYPHEILESSTPARTAAEAAARVGCQVAQIAKSLVFRLGRTGRPLLVVTSGANRVDEARLAERLGEPVEKATAEFVREHTGFAIGGVPPVGHAKPLEVLVDQDLLGWDEIWAAAGTPNAVFRLRPADLVAMTGGAVVKVS